MHTRHTEDMGNVNRSTECKGYYICKVVNGEQEMKTASGK